MIKQAPSVGRILTMVAFALSCFGILVFLWLSFGGSVPLQPEGYRFSVSFPSATQLAQESDVRISGVRVGRVKKLEPDEETGLTKAEIEIESRYAPIPRNTRAILRQKTLLGETYVELTPGDPSSGRVPDGGTLASGQVGDTVELDEIFRTLDPVTREKFSIWMDQQGRAVADNGADINAALGNLTPFAEETDDVLEVLRGQSGATRRLIRNTGEVFTALSERRGQLRSLISNSERVWRSFASRDADLADTFRVFPTFLREGRQTTNRVTRFADDTDPLVDQLRPAARALSPTLIDLDRLAPDLRGFFRDLDPLVRVSRRGLPAVERVLDNTRPLLVRIDPFLREFTPIVDYLGLYKREIAAFFANDAAATQRVDPPIGTGQGLHQLRTSNPLNPEILTAWPFRLGTNRSNVYQAPGGFDKLRTEGHLEVTGSYLCTTNPTPQQVTPLDPWVPQALVDDIQEFVYGGDANRNAAPPCDAQTPLGSVVGQSGTYPQLQPLP